MPLHRLAHVFRGKVSRAFPLTSYANTDPGSSSETDEEGNTLWAPVSVQAGACFSLLGLGGEFLHMEARNVQQAANWFSGIAFVLSSIGKASY